MSDDRLQHALARAAAQHDHLCPRQVLGARMGIHAGDLLVLDVPQTDKRLLTIVETDGCFVDGISAATGCTIGHRTLRHEDQGKVAATFVDTHSGAAIRLHPSPAARELAARYAPHARDRWHTYLDGYQVMPVAELLVATSVRLVVSVASLVSHADRRATCDACGEEIFNEREVRRPPEVLCRACAGDDYLQRHHEPAALATGRG